MPHISHSDATDQPARKPRNAAPGPAPISTPRAILALQRAAGNQAVASLAGQPTGRVLARTGKVIAGSFAARVGNDEKIIQVLPWTDLNGNNNNFFYID